MAGTILCKEVKIINVKTRGCQASDPHSANTAEDLAKNAETEPCMSSTLLREDRWAVPVRDPVWAVGLHPWLSVLMECVHPCLSVFMSWRME